MVVIFFTIILFLSILLLIYSPIGIIFFAMNNKYKMLSFSQKYSVYTVRYYSLFVSLFTLTYFLYISTQLSLSLIGFLELFLFVGLYTFIVATYICIFYLLSKKLVNKKRLWWFVEQEHIIDRLFPERRQKIINEKYKIRKAAREKELSPEILSSKWNLSYSDIDALFTKYSTHEYTKSDAYSLIDSHKIDFETFRINLFNNVPYEVENTEQAYILLCFTFGKYEEHWVLDSIDNNEELVCNIRQIQKDRLRKVTFILKEVKDDISTTETINDFI